MSGAEKPTLPGTPGPTLQGLLNALLPPERAALEAHLLGGTSAEWLSLVLTNYGHRISATTIKTYRRSLSATAG